MKVSFDFDGTLQQEEVQEYAKELISRGIDVWVVTTRYDENHEHLCSSDLDTSDLWEVVDKLGIPKHKVRFTCMQWKWEYLKNTKFVWHLDDNHEESRYSRQNNCKVPMVMTYLKDWRQKCEDLLNGEIKNMPH